MTPKPHLSMPSGAATMGPMKEDAGIGLTGEVRASTMQQTRVYPDPRRTGQVYI